jgi:lysine-N-methylase
MYSKEIENSEKTLYDLEEMFNTSEIFDLKINCYIHRLT